MRAKFCLMKSPLLEILVPVNHEISDELAFRKIESVAKSLNLPAIAGKRLLSVAMEMFQNLKNHAHRSHLSMIRVRNSKTGLLEIASLNFADDNSSKRLSSKHDYLKKLENRRESFVKKISLKTQNLEKPGNLGLDICFKYAKSSKLKTVQSDNQLNLIYLAFLLDINGKSHS
jgi:hypothetical protein